MSTLSTNFTFGIIIGKAIIDGVARKTTNGKDRAFLVVQTKKTWNDLITGEKRTLSSEHQIIGRTPQLISEMLKITRNQIVLVKGTLESYKTEKNPGDFKQYSYILANVVKRIFEESADHEEYDHHQLTHEEDDDTEIPL